MNKLRSLLFENFGWKALSLASAITLWWLVASEPELAGFATVRLEYKNLPEDLEISSEPVGSVTLELQGPSLVLRGVGDGGVQPAVVLDMSDVAPGERTFTISHADVQLPRGVRLVRAIPSEVRFAFDRHMVREIPVNVRLTGAGKNGYVVASCQAAPAELRLVGPAGRLARIVSVVTDPVDVSNVVGSQEFRVNAFIDDPYVRFEGSPQVTVTVTMRKK
ncbi:MAG TPA: CdaR family protein [Bryobacteraceae bacterium]|nr:CdaR family protein [Bryobacteraceae bacterium]